jgi:hypothetical protein
LDSGSYHHLWKYRDINWTNDILRHEETAIWP